MKIEFPNEIKKIDIDVQIPEPVVTVEEQNKIIKKHFSKLNTAVFSFVFAATAVLMLTLERPVKSDTENRELTKLPEYSKESLLNGSYTAGIADYYNDTVPGRSYFKNLAASIKDYTGINKDGIKIYTVNRGTQGNKTPAPVITTAAETTVAESSVTEVANTDITTSPVTEITEETTVTTTPEPIPEDDVNDAGELSNDIMIYKNRGIPIFYGSYESGNDYASIVNEYKERLGDSVNVYSMICPTAMSFYWPASSDISHGDEKDHIENVHKQLVNVTDVNIFDTLMNHRSEAIYSRTDHHWQPLGAYYAAKVFAETAKVPFDELSDYEKVSVPGYVGTLYGFSGASVLNDNPEDFVFYKPDNKYTTSYYSTSFEYEYSGELLVEAYGSSLYCTFMGGDEKIVHVETDAPNDRTLFIIKDSYGNALVPCLTNSFKNIYVVDMRYFQPNIIDFMKEHGATDLLFSMNTFSAFGSNYLNLRTILNQ